MQYLATRSVSRSRIIKLASLTRKITPFAVNDTFGPYLARSSLPLCGTMRGNLSFTLT